MLLLVLLVLGKRQRRRRRHSVGRAAAADAVDKDTLPLVAPAHEAGPFALGAGGALEVALVGETEGETVNDAECMALPE